MNKIIVSLGLVAIVTALSMSLHLSPSETLNCEDKIIQENNYTLCVKSNQLVPTIIWAVNTVDVKGIIGTEVTLKNPKLINMNKTNVIEVNQIE